MPGLILLALIAGFFGVVFASQATVGVALVGVACLFAILARMRQAHVYQSQWVQFAREMRPSLLAAGGIPAQQTGPLSPPKEYADLLADGQDRMRASANKIIMALGFVIVAVAIGLALTRP